ncbi:MAG: T9SS type A sorting domain-containing protein [Flavobacteriales bacterium]|nr:T9SS type A sorting domain-containing protein [Flavobacteriales bacterium]
MKKLYTLFIAVLITVSAFSQAYKPMLKENKTWEDILEYWNQLPLQNHSHKYSIYYINGDTMVNGTQYQKLYSHDTTTYGAGNTIIPGYPSQNNGYKLIREDTTTRKIWLRYQFSFDTISREVLLYDFSLNVGDTVQSFNVYAYNPSSIHTKAVIDSIGLTTLNNNEVVRKFHLTPLFTHQPTYFIESIGGEFSFLIPLEPVFEYTSLLTCVKDSGIVLHNPGWHPCGSIVGINNNYIINSLFELYPNPNNGENILISGKDLNLIKIYNIHSQLIKTVVIENDKTELSLINQSKGIYLVKAQFSNGEIVTKKLILTR